MFQRYAVYYTPVGALAEVGAAWLGWDSASGMTVPHPCFPDIDLVAATETPRKYGLHGTIKPPFFLADGMEATALSQELEALCGNLAAVTTGPLELRRLGGFFALTPTGNQSALARLAACVVTKLDHFRAPPSPEEVEKRRKAQLTPQQEKNLSDWGYPYVMEEFRFHITLTGRIKGNDAPIMSALQAQMSPVLGTPFELDTLTLLGQADTGMFHVISRIPLRG